MLPCETGCVGPFPTQSTHASGTTAPIPEKFNIYYFKPTQKTIPERPHSTVQSPRFCQTGWLLNQDPLEDVPGHPPPPSNHSRHPRPTAKAQSFQLNVTF